MQGFNLFQKMSGRKSKKVISELNFHNFLQKRLRSEIHQNSGSKGAKVQENQIFNQGRKLQKQGGHWVHIIDQLLTKKRFLCNIQQQNREYHTLKLLFMNPKQYNFFETHSYMPIYCI